MSTATLVSTTLAGTVASFVENGITYPLEYLKVRQQLAVRPGGLAATFAIPQFTSIMYHGFPPFVIGNVLKTVLRFNVFNSASKFMADSSQGRPSAPVVVVAGLITGMAETLVVVPFESIKTTMIEASSVGKGAAVGCLPPLGAQGTQLVASNIPQRDPNGKASNNNTSSSRGVRKVRPQASTMNSYPSLAPVVGPRSTVKTIYAMYTHRGLRAFVQGFNPTVVRQTTNSMLRFTSWNAWAQVVAVDGEENMSIYKLLAGSAVVSGIEAVATQPIDVIKTRMQSANGLKLYGNSLVCAYRTFVEEGWRELWAGLGPRWVRKWLSGGLMWFVYETSFARIDKSMREHPFK